MHNIELMFLVNA